MGGPIGLKGTDGWARDDLERMGATARASSRATLALAQLGANGGPILCASGGIGADAVRDAGLDTCDRLSARVGDARCQRHGPGVSCAHGGWLRPDLVRRWDRTARDICQALGRSISTLGIPAGVKIHSRRLCRQARRSPAGGRRRDVGLSDDRHRRQW